MAKKTSRKPKMSGPKKNWVKYRLNAQKKKMKKK